MNICKSLKSIFSGRRLLVFLTALMLISVTSATLVPITAYARPFNPPDGRFDPIDKNPPPYRPPANGFTWSVPPRYGLNQTDDGLMDTYWRAASFDYDPAYIYPDFWPMRFSGCQTGPDAEAGASTTNTYEWNIAGTIVSDGRCFFTYNGFTQQGTYPVTLTYTPQGGTPVSFTQDVYIHDYFLVAIGDSLASGEGNPDVRQQVVPTDPFGGWIPGAPARWQDQRCHRTAYAYPSKAALELEYSDPHTSVTFISFACSGATIFTPAWDPKGIVWNPPFPPYIDADPDVNKYKGTGILGPYFGAEWGDYTQSTFIPPQIEQLRAALDAPEGKAERRFDALIISAGGNDLHLADIATSCLFDPSCWPDAMVWENSTLRVNIEQLINRALTPFEDGGSPSSLPDAFAALKDNIAGNEIKQIPALYPQPAQVYITQYADQTRDNNSGYCRMLDDIFWPLDLAGTPEESQQLSNAAINGLNEAIEEAAGLYGWNYVDGISYYVDPLTGNTTPGEFVEGPDGRGHGYCASDNWIVRADESEKIQGPAPWQRFRTRGTMHPNLKGIQVLKDRLLHYLRPDLEATLPGNPPGDPPTFSSSLTSGGLTSQPGANGWFTQSCDSNNNCSDQVVLQVTATGSAPLVGASVYLNDSDQSGCSVAGVACPRTVITPTNEVIWDFTFTADGVYQMQFSASDSNDQIADYLSEIKVDLEDPFFASLPGPYTIDEGSSITLTAVASDTTSAILNLGWDLDNDGLYETPDEQPAYSAAALDGPLSQAIGVLVTDEAGRSSAASTTIDVLNVAPAVTISGAPATSTEGTAISLTSSVTDPGTADTFTYDWVVKKDGVSYASGADANFTFTPNDNGSYEVTLGVTDDDGGVGTAIQTIAVTNAAPGLSNVSVSPGTVNEGASVTLTGSISDAGSADSFSLTIDWKDGSTPELVSLAAGSTSFSRNHTYADDNPTGTASDTYSIALSLTDDDGGSGLGSASVVVNNLAPSVSISAPENGNLYAVNATVNLSASLTDASSLDTLTCSINWDDGTTGSGSMAAGVCTASHVYSAAGVYTIQMTGTDDDTGAKTVSVMVVVYDPSAGFVTGGGWIDSPAGAYTADPSLIGRAHFGFVSKYQKGATQPVGKTQFRFQAGDFSFDSEVYDWLVVAGARAQFKGTGYVNGVSGYSFLLTLTDGEINGGGGVDKFRIKIWDANGVVYDNMIGTSDDIDSANPQAIGGGSIVIHSK